MLEAEFNTKVCPVALETLLVHLGLCKMTVRLARPRKASKGLKDLVIQQEIF